MLLPFLLGFSEVLVTPKLTNFVSGFFAGWDLGLNQEAGANPLLNTSMLVALVDFNSKIMTTRLGVIVLKCMLYISTSTMSWCDSLREALVTDGRLEIVSFFLDGHSIGQYQH